MAMTESKTALETPRPARATSHSTAWEEQVRTKAVNVAKKSLLTRRKEIPKTISHLTSKSYPHAAFFLFSFILLIHEGSHRAVHQNSNPIMTSSTGGA